MDYGIKVFCHSQLMTHGEREKGKHGREREGRGREGGGGGERGGRERGGRERGDDCITRMAIRFTVKHINN